METLTVVALLVIATISALAVLHPAFNDTLIQRISLSVICIGALSLVWFSFKNTLPAAIQVIAIAGAAYALECGRVVRMNQARKHDATKDRRLTK